MDFPLPPVGEGLIEVELVRWLVNPGDHVRPGQGLMEVLSDKATMEVPAPFDGTIRTLTVAPGSKITVGQVVLAYDAGNGAVGIPAKSTANPGKTLSASVAASVATAPTKPATSPNRSNGDHAPTGSLPPAAPSVRLLARRLGIDLTRVQGTGPHGRILLDDLTPHITHPTIAVTAPVKSDTPALDLGTPGTTVKLAGIRRKIAEHMLASKRNIPHYSYIDECDFTDLVSLRNQLREPFQKQGVKLTYLAFLVKAVARALKEVPIVNSSFDEEREEITVHAHYHVGFAVATHAGLVVPVIRDADRKPLSDIAREIERLSTEARAGKVKLEDLRGGTFTVTSIGNVGGLISTPIVNHPEVGILGVGKIVKRPVYDTHGNIRPADIAYLSFSFDHRILDGAIGATFGNAVVKQLLAPGALLVGE